MDTDRINRWLTLTANFGVIVSLLFLAYEINQSTKATIAAASQGLTDQSINYFEAQLDPVLYHKLSTNNGRVTSFPTTSHISSGYYNI